MQDIFFKETDLKMEKPQDNNEIDEDETMELFSLNFRGLR